MEELEEELKKRFHFIYDWEVKRFANLFLNNEELEKTREKEEEEQEKQASTQE